MIFDDILAGCIEALEQGATVDECLAHYPAQAAALEPLLRVVVALRSEAQTRMSSQAFTRGRSALRQRVRQAVQQRLPLHRPPHLAAPQQNRKTHHSPHVQNGATQPRRSLAAKRALTTKQSGWGRDMQRVLSMALLLVLLVGATSLTRRVMSSLPGTLFYPIKNVGEQGVGVLMQAAGEEIPWHATQAENGLQELAQLSQPEVAAVQALVKVIEEHWKSVLTATQRLPVAERVLVLQARITRLQQIEAEWTSAQTETSPTAVLTVRKMITAGEQLLIASQSVESVATTVPTAIPTTIPITQIPTTQSTATIIPTVISTATPLLQATVPVLTRVPVLVGTATPEATTVDLIPATETPSPTLLATVPPTTTPMPVITAQMPQESNRQESNSQESNNQASNSQESAGSDADEDKNNSTESASAVSKPVTNPENGLTPEASDSLLESEPTLQTPASVTTIDATVSDSMGATVEPTVATLSVTPVIGESPTTPVENTEENEAPPITATVESTPLTSSKSTPSPSAAPELLATETPRPTNQPTATKPPRPTATPEKATATAPVATPIEKTPKPTAQPTETPRPTFPSSEATKVPQP